MDTNSTIYKIGKKYKIFKGFINNLQAQWFENDNVKKVRDFFNRYPSVKRVARVGSIAAMGIAFKTALGADVHLFSPEVAYADEVNAEPLSNDSADLSVVDKDEKIEVSQSAEDKTVSESPANSTSEVKAEDTTSQADEKEEVKTTEMTETKSAEEVKENDVKEETSTKEDNTQKETTEDKKVNYEENEKKISEESKNGHYLEPTYAIDGVDISDSADKGKTIFDANKTNCIIITDSNGNTKIWTLDSYGNANHGVASNQETLINNLKNSSLTNLNPSGSHELVWPGFDNTDENGISHCAFDGGEITYDPKTNEYTVTYDKTKYSSTMGVETSGKYEINPDEVEPSKPTEDKSEPTPDEDEPKQDEPKQDEPKEEEPDKPKDEEPKDEEPKKETPKPEPKKETPVTFETTTVKTGDELDVGKVIGTTAALGAAGAIGYAGHKLSRSSELEELNLLKEYLENNMSEDMAEDLVESYANNAPVR